MPLGLSGGCGISPSARFLDQLQRLVILAQATDCRVTDVIGPSDVRKHLPGLTACNRFSSLMAGQLRLPTKDYPSGLRALAPLTRPRSNQLALELGEPPKTVSIKRPCAVVVSAQVSLSDLKPAPFSAIVPSRFRRSRVDRAKRSSRVTTNTSSFARTAIG